MHTPPPDVQADTPLSEWVTAFEREGCLLIRQILDLEHLKALRWRAQQAYARADVLRGAGKLSPTEQVLDRYGHVPAEACYAPHNPFLELVELLAPCRPLLEALLPEPVLLYRVSLFRRQTAEGSPAAPLPWHQDSAFLGELHPVLNCWSPLEPCDGTRPGLELLRQNLCTALRPTAEAGDDYTRMALSETELQTRFPTTPRWCPDMEPGDLLLFHEHMLHRTAWHPHLLKARHSLEMRVTSASTAAARSSLLIPLHTPHG